MLPGLDAALRRRGLGVHPRAWRLPPIDTYPRVVAWAQTWPGKAVLFTLFAALLAPLTPQWPYLVVAAAVVSHAGRYRHHAVLLCTALLLWRGSGLLWLNAEAITN